MTVDQQVAGGHEPGPTGAKGIVLVNPDSGPNETTVADVAAAIPAGDVRPCPPEELADALRAALAEGVPWVGVAGGDGSQRTAAAVLAGTGVPLLVVPAGTRNHFARELGLDTLELAGAAAADPRPRRVDLGQVNDEVFINNASVGFYASLVRERVRDEHRMPKRVADVVAAWKQSRKGHRFPVEVDGRPARVWLVFVGNGCYGDNLADLADRQALDGGLLDVRVVKVDRALARTRIVLALIVGRLARSPMVEQWQAEVLHLRGDAPQLDVALDGEVRRLESPLRFRSRPEALTVLAAATDGSEAG